MMRNESEEEADIRLASVCDVADGLKRPPFMVNPIWPTAGTFPLTFGRPLLNFLEEDPAALSSG